LKCSGYVSEIRKKDWKIGHPFSLEGDRNDQPQEQTSFLPPLDVPKFRWWRCQNCLSEVAAKDNGTVFKCCSTKCRSNSTCSHVGGSAAVLLSGFQQVPKLVQNGRPVLEANNSKLSNDDHLLLCSDKKNKKAEVAQGTIKGTTQSSSVLMQYLVHYLLFGSCPMFSAGHDVSSEDNVKQEVSKLTSTVSEVISSMIPERHTKDAGNFAMNYEPYKQHLCYIYITLIMLLL
jgi:hypothetical protein